MIGAGRDGSARDLVKYPSQEGRKEKDKVYDLDGKDIKATTVSF